MRKWTWAATAVTAMLSFSPGPSAQAPTAAQAGTSKVPESVRRLGPRPQTWWDRSELEPLGHRREKQRKGT